MPLTLPTLESWADLLLSAFAGCSPADASLVRLVAPADAPGEVELGLLRLDGAHPCAVLDELVLDHALGPGDACLALGVVSGGWAAPPGGPPSGHPDAERILQVVLVAPGGEVVARLRFPDGTVLSSPPSEGRVLRSLRDALGVGR